jgi:hypothetical protein
MIARISDMDVIGQGIYRRYVIGFVLQSVEPLKMSSYNSTSNLW